MKQKHVYAILTRYSETEFLCHINKLSEINTIFTGEFRRIFLCSTQTLQLPPHSLKSKSREAVGLSVIEEVNSLLWALGMCVCWWRKIYSLMLQAFIKAKEFSKLSC